MNPEIIELLRDPATHERLEYRPSTPAGASLVNAVSGKSFPVQDDVARFTEEAEVSGLDKKAQRFYDVIAPIYDGMIRYYFVIRGLKEDETAFRKEYLKEISLAKDSKVLEVSIGSGTNLNYLPPDCRYFGVDISLEMLKLCQKNLRRWGRSAHLFQANADALPFADDTFDIVLNVGSFKHYLNKQRAMDEMLRVTRPGGRVLIVDQTGKTAGEVVKVPLIGPYFKKLIEVQHPPVDLVPPTAENRNFHTIVDGRFYCLRFDKPVQAASPRP